MRIPLVDTINQNKCATKDNRLEQQVEKETVKDLTGKWVLRNGLTAEVFNWNEKLELWFGKVIHTSMIYEIPLYWTPDANFIEPKFKEYDLCRRIPKEDIYEPKIPWLKAISEPTESGR